MRHATCRVSADTPAPDTGICSRFGGEGFRRHRGRRMWFLHRLCPTSSNTVLLATLPVLAVTAWLLLDAQSAAAQGFTPQEAVGRMSLPEGFEVSLVASEPLVRQPVAIEFDDRGRLWVIQYLQYPNPAGLKRVRVDRYSRTVYDRVPEPPPHGPRGADRITILEDRDGDGRADHGRDFVSGLNLATGLAFGYGGVFVLNVPYLLFYPDRNRDDVPDSDPEVLLSGFGMQDAHSVANSLTWGPDGWLYGCQGSTVTSRIRGIEFQQGVWRYHPETHAFELFCEGGGNSWGLDFDRHGRLLYSTNVGGYVMLHGVQGAYLWKSFGKHGPLHNPYAFGYFDHVPHSGFRGGHVTVGGIFYTGTTFPPEWRGRYIAGDLLGHAVYWHTLKPRGSTFSSAHGGTLLNARDTWFAPTDLTLGPDGAIYVADWYDQRTAHPDPDAEWDRTNGRIYRIQAKRAAGNAATPATVDLSTLTSAALVERLHDANGWYARRALRILAERNDRSIWNELRRSAVDASHPQRALRSLWALFVSGGFDLATAHRLLEHPDEHLRAWTVRLLGERDGIPFATARRLIELAEAESSPVVVAQLAATARRLPADDGLPIVRRLALRDTWADDPHIPLLCWWAVERHVGSEPRLVAQLFAMPAMWRSRLGGQTILSRLVRRYAAEGTTEALAYCIRVLESAPAGVDESRLLAEIDRGLALASRITVDPHDEAVAHLIRRCRIRRTHEPHRLRLAARLGESTAVQRALMLAADVSLATEQRIELLNVLYDVGNDSCIPALLELLQSEQPEELHIAAVRLLARFDDPRIAETLLDVYPTAGAGLRSAIRSALGNRSDWTRRLLNAVEAGSISAKEVTPQDLARMAMHEDADIREAMTRHWGSFRAATPEEKLAEVRRLNNDLRAAPGDAQRGREVFRKRCASCHRLFGEGTELGPDLTHANRSDRDFLLRSLVDPSAQIRREYLNYVVVTGDGRVLTGLIVDQTPATLTLADAENRRTRLPRQEVETMRPSTVSLMPEDLYRQLTPQDLRDLFAYLQK